MVKKTDIIIKKKSQPKKLVLPLRAKVSTSSKNKKISTSLENKKVLPLPKQKSTTPQLKQLQIKEVRQKNKPKIMLISPVKNKITTPVAKIKKEINLQKYQAKIVAKSTPQKHPTKPVTKSIPKIPLAKTVKNPIPKEPVAVFDSEAVLVQKYPLEEQRKAEIILATDYYNKIIEQKSKPTPFEMETAKDIFTTLIKKYGKPNTKDIFIFLSHCDTAYATEVNKNNITLQDQLSTLRNVLLAKSTSNKSKAQTQHISHKPTSLESILLKLII